ncbi:hypothetical protein RF11_05247 [Thelohanellus kitauei]|uniref:Uncharacterized protein n=1 Tax=Thelohanellus kitauei TaxID=669202 RepID=A0A0C2NBJ7_THEKT|nr:hypothetical protein RF11_05247 [Thelohanellus kitauei]
MNSQVIDVSCLMNVDHRWNQEYLYDYISGAKSKDLSVQMEAVSIFISNFSYQHYPQADRLFVKHFPNELFDEFHAMCELQGQVDRVEEKKILFVNVFTFIFRNTNLLKHPKSESMVKLFLKFINMYANQHKFNLEDILDSIEVCILYKPNQILFIQKNGMLNFYRFFQNKINAYRSKFYKACQEVYNLDYRTTSLLSRFKHDMGLGQIMSEYNLRRDNQLAKLFFIVLVILHRLAWLHDTEFFTKFLPRITSSVLHEYKQNNKDNLYMLHASKIWSVILRGPWNRFKIDTTQKLQCAGCVFAIFISSKLKKVVEGSGRFELTTNTKRMIYIIHLTLVSVIDNNPLFLFKKLLKELYTSIRHFFEEDLIEDYTIENQFLLLQLYLKCQITFYSHISPHDKQVFDRLLDRFATYPSLKLHSCFLLSHVLFQYSIQRRPEDSNMHWNLDKIKSFTHDLILALSDDSYITKIQNEQKLLLYEDLKDNHLSMITDACIEDVFTRCSRIFQKKFEYESFEVYGDDWYTFYKKALAKTVLSFYESIFLDLSTVDGHIKVFEDYSGDSFHIPSHKDNYGNVHASISHSQIIYLGKLSIPAILRWFILMFEMKFLYGDIYSNFAELYIS